MWSSPLVADGKVYIGDEDGDLTATQKAKRNVIMDKFSDLIEDMYK